MDQCRGSRDGDKGLVSAYILKAQTPRFASALDCGGVRDLGLFQFWPSSGNITSVVDGFCLRRASKTHPRGGVEEGADIQGWSLEERSEQR